MAFTSQDRLRQILVRDRHKITPSGFSNLPSRQRPTWPTRLPMPHPPEAPGAARRRPSRQGRGQHGTGFRPRPNAPFPSRCTCVTFPPCPSAPIPFPAPLRSGPSTSPATSSTAIPSPPPSPRVRPQAGARASRLGCRSPLASQHPRPPLRPQDRHPRRPHLPDLPRLRDRTGPRHRRPSPELPHRPDPGRGAHLHVDLGPPAQSLGPGLPAPRHALTHPHLARGRGADGDRALTIGFPDF